MLEQTTRNSIRNILTLRYDPEEVGPISHKNWKDFAPTQSDAAGHKSEEILYAGIVNHLIDYDRIAIALSSGVDSSLLLALVRDAYPEKKIVAIHYTGVNNDELEATKKLAIQFDAELKILKPAPVIDRIEFMIRMMDSPKWDCYDYVIPFKAKEEKCDILVSGDGADELFAGYTFRYKQFEQITGGRASWPYVDEQISAYLACHRNDYVTEQEKLFGFNFNWLADIHPYFTEAFKNPLTLMMKLILSDYNGKLAHNFTVKQDKFSKQFDIPIFSPFLTPEMTNFATHIPFTEKYRNGIGKLPLRAICKRMGINPPIQKMGFTHDIKSEWNNFKNKYLITIADKDSLIYKTGMINFHWFIENFAKTEERVINKLVSLHTLEKYLQWKELAWKQ